MASPKNLFRLLLLATLAFFAWTCNVSDSGKGDTILTLTVGDSLKASAGKYDSIQIQVIVVNGSDTSYKKLVFDGAYSNATQLQSLNLGKLPSNDFTIILSGYRQGAVVLVLTLPFTGGKAGTPVLDSLIPPHASVLRMWLSPPDSGLNSLQIKEGITLAFQVMAKDSNAKDTAVLLHFINPLPSACGSPSYDSVSGNFSFKPAFACVDSGGATVMDTLKFMAKDKSNPPVFDTLRLSLIVLDSNSAPKWKEDTVSNLSDKQGRSISLALDSLYLGDAEGDAVSFTASLGNITQNPLGWSFTPSFSDSGVKTITLTATDSHHPPASSSLVLKLAIADSIRAFNVIITSPQNGYVTRDSVIAVHWSVNGINQTTDTTEHLMKQGANGVTRVYHDTLTNSSYSDSITVTRDTVPPNKPNVHVTSPTNNQRPTWNWESGGGGDGYFRQRLDTASFIDTVGAKDTSFTPGTNLAAGSHVLYVEERDDAGNWSAMASASVSIVLSGPLVVVTSPPNNYVTRQASVDVYWTLNGVAQTKVTKNLIEGTNTLFVGGADSAGNKDSTSVTVIRDTVPPNKPIVVGPGLTNSQKPTWTWHSGGGGGAGYYRYKLDTMSLTDTVGMSDSSFAPIINLAQGRHVLYIEERDVAGNWSAMDSSGIATVDTAAPSIQITSPPNNYVTRQATVDVYWTLNGVVEPKVTKNLVEGSNTLFVVGADSAGNKDSTSIIVVRDTVPPNKPVITAPGLTRNLKPTWSWISGGNGGAGYYRYKFDDTTAFTDTTGAKDSIYMSAANLTNGTHTLYVQERDAAGNWSATNSGSAIVDTVPPNKPVVTGPGLTNNQKPKWTWSSGGNNGAGYYRYKLDTSSITSDTNGNTNTSYTPSSNLPQGQHVLYIEERDAAGNWSLMDSSGIARIDITAPVVVITSPADSFVTNQSSVQVAYKIDGVVQTPVTQNLSDGVATKITESSTDSAGNMGSASITVTRKSNVLFVNAAANTGGDGNSWTSAYKYFQTAIARSVSGQQIWVAQGTYKPAWGLTNHDSTYDTSFVMKSGVIWLGGFKGTENDSAKRDWVDNESSLSALKADTTLNSYSALVIGANNSTLDGFVVENLVTGLETGAMYNNGVSPSVLNCTFRHNKNTHVGPGAILNQSGSPVIQNCTFIANVGASLAGAIYNNGGSPTIKSCTFDTNRTNGFGGAIYSFQGTSVISSCSFTNNQSSNQGGAIYVVGSVSTISNNVFYENGATNGGAIDIEDNSVLQNNIFIGNSATNGGAVNSAEPGWTLLNCTFFQNKANTGGGIYINSYTDHLKSVIRNSIFWGNTDPYGTESEIVATSDSSLTDTLIVSYTDITGGTSAISISGPLLLNASTGNISGNPLFKNTANTAGADGKYFTSDDGLNLSSGSPCINTGDPNTSGLPATDITDASRVQSGQVDMGAYEQ